MRKHSNRRQSTILLVGGAILLMASVGYAADEVLITNVAGQASDNLWTPMTYETQDGLAGTLLYAPWGLAPRQKVEIKLPCRGRYDIYLGTEATRYPLSEAPFRFLVRLKRDPAPIVIDPVVSSLKAGWWPQLCEIEWKVADLDGDTLIVENLRGCRASLAWIRLVPVSEKTIPCRTDRRLVVTDDACAPASDLDELLAPIMRCADSPVKAVYFCVGEGPRTFAVPSKIAISPFSGNEANLDNENASICAADFKRLHEKYPDLLVRLAEFAHSIGVEFHVSFRTGCTVDCLRFSQASNAADPGAEACGICRRENYCEAWDGTPVARFSYANDEVQKFFLRFYEEMLVDEVDGINLIWIRALPAMLFEPAFREKFKTAYGEDVASPDDPRVKALRIRIMTDFHRRVRALAGKKRVSIFVPARGEICESFGLDVKTLVREKLIDEVDVGDTLQTADHDESFSYIDFPYFRDACKGSDVPYLAFLWSTDNGQGRKALSSGAGLVFWDSVAKGWSDFRQIRRFADGVGDAPVAPSGSVHFLKTLQGFDMATYPWHVAY